MTSIKILHVLAPGGGGGYKAQGVFENKGIKAQHINLGITLPILVRLKWKNSKIYKKLLSIKLQYCDIKIM